MEEPKLLPEDFLMGHKFYVENKNIQQYYVILYKDSTFTLSSDSKSPVHKRFFHLSTNLDGSSFRI